MVLVFQKILLETMYSIYKQCKYPQRVEQAAEPNMRLELTSDTLCLDNLKTAFFIKLNKSLRCQEEPKVKRLDQSPADDVIS